MKCASNFECLSVHKDRIWRDRRFILLLISLVFSHAFYPQNSQDFARNCHTFCVVPGVKHQGYMSKELCVTSTFFKGDALRDLSTGISFSFGCKRYSGTSERQWGEHTKLLISGAPALGGGKNKTKQEANNKQSDFRGKWWRSNSIRLKLKENCSGHVIGKSKG